MDISASTTNEYDLALRARAGDREAVTRLVEKTRARLFALAYAELRHYEDANDAVANGLLQICRHIQNLREPERVVAWMQSIVRNEAHRLRRGHTETPLLSLEARDEPTDSRGPLLLRLDIERALRQIPVPQAEALRRFYLADLPISAIAAEMDASEGAVKMWLYRGRRSLRTEMEGYEPMAAMKQDTATAPTRSAAILHHDLEPELRQRIKAALYQAGYTTRFLTPSDIGELGSIEPGPWDRLKNESAIVLVEPFGERSVFEYILMLRASGETADIPIAIVTDTFRPDPLCALAFHTLGVAGLASRDAPESLDHLFRWNARNDIKTRIILFADDEARRAGQEKIGTEHLLLALLREKSIVSWLQDKGSVTVDTLREAVRLRMERLPEYTYHLWRTLTVPAETAFKLAREESRDQDFAVEDLLRGLIREPDGLAGQVLRAQGLS
jgi:RNA polymerase sigma factor (sigma-70 family)